MTKPTSAAPPISYAGGLSRREVVAWRNAIFVVFTVCGVGISSWVARLPTVRDSLHASTLEMGVLAFAIAAGSILGLLASSHVIARFGAKTTIGWALTLGAIGFALAGVGVTLGQNFAVTFAGLVVFGAATGITDVSMNVSGAANERVLRRSIMPVFHAFFSVGAMIGAGLGAVSAAIRLPIAIHTGIIAVAIVVVTLWAIRSLQSEHIVEDHEQPVPDDDDSKSWRGRLSIWGDPRTLLIGVIALGMAFAEGSANDWLALAMVDGRGVSDATGALIFGVFVTSMTVGRFTGVFLLDRFGRVAMLRVSAGFAIAGLLVVIFVPSVGLSIIGVVFWGLGAALGFPVAMSAAADDPKTAAARVSAVATIGYFAFLAGPPVIGFLGQRVGLLHALLVVLVLVTAAGVVSRAARNPNPQL